MYLRLHSFIAHIAARFDPLPVSFSCARLVRVQKYKYGIAGNTAADELNEPTEAPAGLNEADPAVNGYTPRVETARFGRSFGSAPLLEGEIRIPGKRPRRICSISPTPKESVDEEVKVVRT